MKVISINPNYNPKPLTEGEVWQGDPLFPNELRDESEKWLTFTIHATLMDAEADRKGRLKAEVNK